MIVGFCLIDFAALLTLYIKASKAASPPSFSVTYLMFLEKSYSLRIPNVDLVVPLIVLSTSSNISSFPNCIFIEPNLISITPDVSSNPTLGRFPKVTILPALLINSSPFSWILKLASSILVMLFNTLDI